MSCRIEERLCERYFRKAHLVEKEDKGSERVNRGGEEISAENSAENLLRIFLVENYQAIHLISIYKI